MEETKEKIKNTIEIISIVLVVVVSLLFLTGATTNAAANNNVKALPDELSSLAINGQFLNNNKNYPCVLDMGGDNKTYLDISSIIWSKDIECPDKSIDHIIRANLVIMDDNKPNYHPLEIVINEIPSLNRFRLYEYQPGNGFTLISKEDKYNVHYNAGMIFVNLIYGKYISKI